MIAEKCVNITDYDSNFNMEDGYDYITILTNSSSYRYSGEGAPHGMGPTNASLIGLKSPKYMSFSFYR